MNWLDENHYLIGDPLFPGIAEEVLKEVKKKLEYVRKISKKDPGQKDNENIRVILVIDEERKEIKQKNNSKFKHSFRKATGKNQRFEVFG